MDAEAACIVCNWVNSVVWPYFGLGALGAAAAAAAAAAGPFGGDSSAGGGAGSTWPEPEQYDYPRPLPPYYHDYVNHPERYPYTDSEGNPYWPGISEIPSPQLIYPVHPPGWRPALPYYENPGVVYTPPAFAVDPTTGFPRIVDSTVRPGDFTAGGPGGGRG